MRKTDRKLDNTIRHALKQVCNLALVSVDGFQWLTHIVDYDAFPDSVNVICVFASNEALKKARSEQRDDYLVALIQKNFQAVDIKLKNIHQQVKFDTEEDCRLENNGKWHVRLQ